MAAVDSAEAASASPSFFTPPTDAAASERPVPISSCACWTSLADSATWSWARDSDWIEVAVSSIPAASDSTEARISSPAAACSLPPAATRLAASSID